MNQPTPLRSSINSSFASRIGNRLVNVCTAAVHIRHSLLASNCPSPSWPWPCPFPWVWVAFVGWLAGWLGGGPGLGGESVGCHPAGPSSLLSYSAHHCAHLTPPVPPPPLWAKGVQLVQLKVGIPDRKLVGRTGRQHSLWAPDLGEEHNTIHRQRSILTKDLRIGASTAPSSMGREVQTSSTVGATQRAGNHARGFAVRNWCRTWRYASRSLAQRGLSKANALHWWEPTQKKRHARHRRANMVLPLQPSPAGMLSGSYSNGRHPSKSQRQWLYACRHILFWRSREEMLCVKEARVS